MSKIFKNMIPYWKSIVIIIALLFVQAWCDLSLPSYTSDIIDVGIQNYGVEHVVPEALTADEFETAELFMTDEEADLWESIYEKDGDIYRLQVTSRSELNEIDDTLAVPLIMNYQMSAMEDSAVKEHVAKPTGADAGTLEKDTLLSMRDSMEETIDTMGSSLVKSMGAAYAVSCDKAEGEKRHSDGAECGKDSEKLSCHSRTENGRHGADDRNRDSFSGLLCLPCRCRHRKNVKRESI